MRLCKFTAIFLVAFSALLATTGSSFGLIADTTYFDFTGWDHATVTSPAGQDFNLGGGLTVNVMGGGDFSVDSAFVAGFIRDGQLTAGEFNTFVFKFNQSLPLVVKTATVDSQERVGIFGIGPEDYVHDEGAPPTVTPFASGIYLVGNGIGINPVTGAATGETVIASSDRVTVNHLSFNPNKWEFFMIGTVPEPGSLGLLFLGMVSLLQFRRKN